MLVGNDFRGNQNSLDKTFVVSELCIKTSKQMKKPTKKLIQML